MARKRKQQKKRTQQSKLVQRLERLALRGEDEKFLRLAAEAPELESAGLADLYRQVFERHLWRHLRRADLGRVTELLERGPAKVAGVVATLPVSRIANAVLAIEAGRLDDARRELEQIDTEGQAPEGGSASPAELVRQLSALVIDDAAAHAEEPLADFCQLRRALARYGAGKIKRLPSKLRLDWAPARDTLELVRALAIVHPERWPTEKTLHRIRRSARQLLAHRPLDSGVETLASAAIQLTRAARSEALAMKLDHGLRRFGVEHVLELLRQDHSLLSALASDRAPSALAGLRDVVTRRCRSLLTRLAEAGDPRLLARAQAAANGAFDSLFETAEDADSVERWATVQRLVDQEALPALVRWLQEASDAATGMGRMTQLWAVELAMLDRSIDTENEAENDAENDAERDAANPLDDKPPKPSRALPQMLVRLLAMSRQLESRSAPDDEHRPVAKFLRDRLADVFGYAESEKTLPIAETLLRLLPDDAASLLMAYAAAITSERRSVTARLAERIQQQRPAPEAEIPRLLRLVTDPPTAIPCHLEELLPGVEPLFGPAWPRARSAAAQFLGAEAMMSSTLALHAEWSGFPEEARAIRRDHLEGLGAFRSIFGDETIFHISQLVTREILSAPATFRRACEELLAQHQDLEAVLSLTRLLDALTTVPTDNERIASGLEVACEALIQRLDGRCSLWGHAIETLLPQLEKQGRLKLLIVRLRKILGDTTLASAERRQIENHLEHAEIFAAVQKKSFGRPRKRPRKRRAKKKAAPAVSPQLDLFERLRLEDES